ncbi:predicted protein [Chaetoceros tenuissimus]|uniref:HSF-type DNA-binding domain-containing protein n=1 Tax=Chaetoceros tenuissimus TaxID=426638 RepID=A0AAD3CX06_9STRA|nr:predicted protein [Chaetoceros tenuissimus]
MSSSDNSEGNNKTDDPYERMLVFLTGKRSEDRKSKEKAIRFPVKLMYIIQCGDYNHLIDWFEEANDPFKDNDTPGESKEKREEHESNRRTVSVIEKNSGLYGDDEVKNDDSGDNHKKDNEGNELNSNNLPPPQSTAFIIYDKAAFETHVLPAIFKERKFNSFERKLYRWGFAKQKTTRRRSTPDFSLKTSFYDSSSSSIYEHPYFCKGDYATASTIACSGSEVKRYKQMQKDKKKQIPKRRRGSKISTTVSSILSNNTETSPAIAPTDRKIAAAENIDNASSTIRTRPPPKDNQLYLEQEDHWNALYLSALRSSNEEEEEEKKKKKKLASLDCKSGHEEEDDEGPVTFVGPSRFREEFMSTAMMASCLDDEEQRTEERAQTFGLHVAASQHVRDQSLGETNSSTMTNMLLQEQDSILLQHLRRRRNGRQIILEMIQRSYQN